MTTQELTQSLNMMLTNYSKDYDVNIYTLWKGLFINFDNHFFQMACLKIISSSRFFPNASELIDAYQIIKQEATHERHEKLRENQRLLSAGQAHCYLCNNSGFCFYMASGNEYAARCVCSRGRDLNQFPESQTKRDHVPELLEHYAERDKADIKRGKNPFYYPTIQEVLKDDYAIFEARKKEQYLSRETVDDKQKAEILKKLAFA